MVNHLISSKPYCACGSKKLYLVCCQPYHLGAPAPNAELLMRSRYTAYAMELEDYLLSTWHPDTRPTHLNLTTKPPLKWIGLTIKRYAQTSDATAIVEFVARYKIQGKAERLTEQSEFVKLDRWYYLAGTHA